MHAWDYYKVRSNVRTNLPPGGKTLTFLKGSTGRIEVCDMSYTGMRYVQYRAWYFTSSEGHFNRKLIGEIYRERAATIEIHEVEFDLEKPGTLIIKNPNSTYNGTYIFELYPGALLSEVFVFIAGKFNCIPENGLIKSANSHPKTTCKLNVCQIVLIIHLIIYFNMHKGYIQSTET